MKNRLLLIVIFIALLFTGQSEAVTIRAEASPQIEPGVIQVGSPFTVDIYLENNDGFDHVGYSWPLCFYSPDQSITNVIHRNVQSYSADSIPYTTSYNDSSIIMLGGFETAFLIPPPTMTAPLLCSAVSRVIGTSSISGSVSAGTVSCRTPSITRRLAPPGGRPDWESSFLSSLPFKSTRSAHFVSIHSIRLTDFMTGFSTHRDRITPSTAHIAG